MTRWAKLGSVALVLCLLAGACGGDDDGGDAAGEEGSEETEEPQSGGELVIGAEQFPKCINPFTQCANSSWMHWATVQYALPKLMELNAEGNYVPSPLLDGEPVLSGAGTGNGDGPFTVTYTLRDEAVWDDETPITCADLEFSRQAVLETTGTLTTVNVEDVQSITPVDGDDKVCAMEFKRPLAAWTEVLGSATQYVLKADAFDSPDVADALATELPFSGGPFILESFDPNNEAVLVRNDNYWDPDRMPLLDQVTVIALADQETEFNALLAGEVAAIYPQPAPGVTQQLDDENVEFEFGAGTTWEALFFTIGSLLDPETPLADKAVREALLYAVDRDAILKEIITPDFPETVLLNCLGWVPTVGDWCDQTDFADVKFDPAKVASVLEAAGWAKGGDGIYAKGGKNLELTWQTVAGNNRRESIQDLVIPQLAELGIAARASNVDADTLFQQLVPQLQTEIALYAQVLSPDPSVTPIFGCANIPTEENNFSGQNNTAWCNQRANELMLKADETPDETARLDLTRQIGDIARAEAVGLPFYQLPLITAWRTDMVEGPGAFTSSPLSGFWDLYDWSVPT
ncbi:MAG: ABC transporter substrate-binding protein [Acidimicrobiia bacterium]